MQPLQRQWDAENRHTISLSRNGPEPSTSMSGSRPGHPEDDAGSSANYKTSPKGAHVPKVPSPILTQIGNRSSSKAGGGYPL